ncbi:Reticulon-like protein B4 [Capsicum baccatum]|uniref:Reticulon-like protein B4 n=1 Tax=Capsicum baccatum TaxID=33114 RepID=A0A2G2W659_CAPBA|nr:Reticulon-like protein B4 [Capsicum baccatum]
MENIEKKFDGEKVIEEFEVLTKDADSFKFGGTLPRTPRIAIALVHRDAFLLKMLIKFKKRLQKILEENGGTKYLKQWGLNERTNAETFNACVPIVTYKDLEPGADPEILVKGKRPHIPEVYLPEKSILDIVSALSIEINHALYVLREIATGRDLKKLLSTSCLATVFP